MNTLPSNEQIKSQLSISDILKHYGGECTNQSSGAWWCLIHEAGGKNSGHKTPSLVAKDSTGTATCMSQNCFESDDIFGVIAKMENLDIRNDFAVVKKRACEIAGMSTDSHIETPQIEPKKDNSKPIKTGQIEALGQKHIKYLQSIGISKETANFFKLKSRYDYILYPQIENDEVVGYKGITITKDKETGKSKMFFEGAKVSIWGNVVKEKHIIFVEGEKDCLRLTEEITKQNEQDKYSVLTITTGAKTVPSDLLEKMKVLKPSQVSIIYDNDKTGYEGSKKLSEALIEDIQSVSVYYFNSDNKDGYDVSDFLNEGGRFEDLFGLEKEIFEKEIKTINSEYPRYIINKNSILDTLEPDRILRTGYKEIDEKCPIVLGENTIIVGRTGKGKTVLGVNFVNGILKNNQESKVLVFSLELKKKAFLQRLLSAEYDIETWKIKKGFSSDNTNFTTQKERYIESAEKYIKEYENRLMIIDDVHSIDKIEKIVEDLKDNLQFVPDYILIDYANILSLKNLVDATKHIQISTWIKFLAKEKNIHIQAVCQANRATRDNDDGYARTENLADSDQYGRDAFIVYSIKTDKETDVYSINPTKNRNGKPEEEIELKWNAESGRIVGSDERNNRIEI